MSLTSYRAAPPRVNNVSGYSAQPGVFVCGIFYKIPGAAPPRVNLVFGLLNSAFVQDDGLCVAMYEGFDDEALLHRSYRPGGDLLSRALRRSTIGPGRLNDRVRNGIGWGPPGIATRSTGRM